MSIDMSMHIRWTIALNNSDLEWHKFQQEIKKVIEKQFIFNLPVGQFSKVSDIIVEDRNFDLYARRDSRYADVEFALIEVPKAADEHAVD